MRKHISVYMLIICFCIIFSSSVSAQLRQGDLERILELNTIVEETMLNFPQIEPRQFRDVGVQKRFNDFIVLDRTLKTEILREFRRGNLSRNTMADISRNYSNFIYFTNRTFLYHEIEEQIGRSQQTINALQGGYDSMRTSFIRIRSAVVNN